MISAEQAYEIVTKNHHGLKVLAMNETDTDFVFGMDDGKVDKKIQDPYFNAMMLPMYCISKTDGSEQKKTLADIMLLLDDQIKPVDFSQF